MNPDNQDKQPAGHDVEKNVPREAGSVDDVPYSVYTAKEKWLIVAMVALAGFYRYVNLQMQSTSNSSRVLTALVLCQPTSTSQLYQPLPRPLANQSTPSTKPSLCISSSRAYRPCYGAPSVTAMDDDWCTSAA